MDASMVAALSYSKLLAHCLSAERMSQSGDSYGCQNLTWWKSEVCYWSLYHTENYWIWRVTHWRFFVDHLTSHTYAYECYSISWDIHHRVNLNPCNYVHKPISYLLHWRYAVPVLISFIGFMLLLLKMYLFPSSDICYNYLNIYIQLSTDM